MIQDKRVGFFELGPWDKATGELTKYYCEGVVFDIGVKSAGEEGAVESSLLILSDEGKFVNEFFDECIPLKGQFYEV